MNVTGRCTIYNETMGLWPSINEVQNMLEQGGIQTNEAYMGNM